AEHQVDRFAVYVETKSDNRSVFIGLEREATIADGPINANHPSANLAPFGDVLCGCLRVQSCPPQHCDTEHTCHVSLLCRPKLALFSTHNLAAACTWRSR